MSDLNRWWSLPVNEFFDEGNWSGKPLDRQSKTGDRVGQLSDIWQISSVKAFFESCPWLGEVSITNPVTLLEPSACLSVSVTEFFNLVPWGAAIATAPQVVKTPNLMQFAPPVTKQHTIDDLSQLF